MEVIEQLQSKRGVRVRIERHHCPDSRRVPYITLCYDWGQHPGWD